MAGSYYLMSACQTADEFVAAFRRYAEKTLLFVPTATPLPNGTRARIAANARSRIAEKRTQVPKKRILGPSPDEAQV